ncbi:MAG: hypothetical protein ACREI3_11475, partial [Nitrospirales bacterium]
PRVLLDDDPVAKEAAGRAVEGGAGFERHLDAVAQERAGTGDVRADVAAGDAAVELQMQAFPAQDDEVVGRRGGARQGEEERSREDEQGGQDSRTVSASCR